MDVVWMKKDVRLRDHAPLVEAASVGSMSHQRRPVLLLFVYEPDQLSHHSMHGSHVLFGNEGLLDLEQQLGRLLGAPGGRCLTLMRGEITAALEGVVASGGRIARLLSHEETGHGASYERDRRVARWCKANGVAWREFPQSGVVRGLRNRVNADFAKRWTSLMSSTVPQDPSNDPGLLEALRRNLIRGFDCAGAVKDLQSPEQLGLEFPEDRPGRQEGGETRALELLGSFVASRGEHYGSGVSSPNSAWSSCSRLSAHLSFGHVSLRQVFQALGARQAQLRALTAAQRGPTWIKSLSAAQSRLRWRSHFMQKLETQPEIEHQNQCRAFDGLRTRDGDWDEALFRAWAEGRTGYPMVDACMRCLLQTGWLNFRMRAMVASFASYNLWLDWRGFAPHLARCFLDYEPGIHYPQLQMQAGVTGINALRVYSATKQGLDHDPKGVFIRKYIPELAMVPDKYIHDPSKMPEKVQDEAQCLIGFDYPRPIVDEKETAKHAKERIAEVSRELKTKAEAKEVYDRHGSRMPRPSSKNARKTSGDKKKRKPSNGEYTEHGGRGASNKRQRGGGAARPKGTASIARFLVPLPRPSSSGAAKAPAPPADVAIEDGVIDLCDCSD